MAVIKKFEDLKVWQDARAFRKEVSAAIKVTPLKNDYDLKRQIQRAALSTMANISEGFERGTTKDFIHFLFMSKASIGEVRSHLYAALDDEVISETIFNQLTPRCIEISSQLSKFISYLETSDKKTRNPKQIKP